MSEIHIGQSYQLPSGSMVMVRTRTGADNWWCEYEIIGDCIDTDHAKKAGVTLTGEFLQTRGARV